MVARPTVLLCDFDGTVTAIDTGVLVLEKFARGDWRALDELYDRGGATVEEVLTRQFAMVGAKKWEILNAVEGKAPLRRGFTRLVRFCNQEGILLTIVSYGLDFCIGSVLGKAGLRGKVEVVSPLARFAKGGIVLDYPKRTISGSVNMKDDIVLQHKKSGHKVVFVGDGTSDFPAAREADECFVVRGSRLEEMCRAEGVRSLSILSFGPVEDALRESCREDDTHLHPRPGHPTS